MSHTRSQEPMRTTTVNSKVVLRVLSANIKQEPEKALDILWVLVWSRRQHVRALRHRIAENSCKTTRHHARYEPVTLS